MASLGDSTPTAAPPPLEGTVDHGGPILWLWLVAVIIGHIFAGAFIVAGLVQHQPHVAKKVRSDLHWASGGLLFRREFGGRRRRRGGKEKKEEEEGAAASKVEEGLQASKGEPVRQGAHCNWGHGCQGNQPLPMTGMRGRQGPRGSQAECRVLPAMSPGNGGRCSCMSVIAAHASTHARASPERSTGVRCG